MHHAHEREMAAFARHKVEYLLYHGPHRTSRMASLLYRCVEKGRPLASTPTMHEGDTKKMIISCLSSNRRAAKELLQHSDMLPDFILTAKCTPHPSLDDHFSLLARPVETLLSSSLLPRPACNANKHLHTVQNAPVRISEVVLS